MRRSTVRRRGVDVVGDTAPQEAVPEPNPEPTPVSIPPITLDEPAGGPPPLRIGLIAAMAVLAAATMVGGIFTGVAPRIYAAVAGLLGIALALRATRVRRPLLMYLLVVFGLVAVAFLVTVPAGFSHVTNIARDVRESARLGNLARPPVEFLPGWRPILGLLMAAVGFAAAWAGLEMQRPTLALAIPIPVVAIAAISVPDTQQLGSGLVALALFGAGLGILSGTEQGEGRATLAYELRRAVRALPLIGVITLVMYLLAQTNFLFPKPIYNPAEQAQKPRAVPLSQVKDRVLFRVDSSITGPWRTGTLDVYDGQFWRLPPFGRTRFVDIASSGVVDPDLAPGIRANIETAGLSGAILPGLANLVGVVAEGPRLVFDQRTQGIRLKQGEVKPGLKYTLIGSQFPSVQALRLASSNIPKDVRPSLDIPDPPPIMQAFIGQARAHGHDAWDQFNFLRQLLLRTVVASGAGTPVAVPPERVGSMLTSRPQSTPYEIVAAQAMLARWVGVPARIGYGFDGGDKVGGKLEVHPRHGATWVEVYFPGYKWIPVIGQPLRANTSLTQAQQQQTSLQASNDIAVQLYFPTVIPPPSQLLERVRNGVAVGLPILFVLVLIYYAWPAIRKSYVRNRRRTWAMQSGPEARIALAYAEWRDHATDYGFVFPADTPLMFLARVVPDQEHGEFAWLVTRALWGDLRHTVTARDAEAAVQLSRSLSRRLAQTQTFVMRVIAGVSRLSLRHPYGAQLGLRVSRERPVSEEAVDVVA